MYYSTQYASPVGKLVLASDGKSLVGLWKEGQRYFGGTVYGEMLPKDELEIFSAVKSWLDRYFAGERPEADELSLAPLGSEFRQTVWRILCRIPYGETITYKEIARKAGERLKRPMMSAQAAGGAVAHNPISIIIPCHRVVGANGSLTGYAGGKDMKIWLLEHEGVDMSGLFWPGIPK